jgi:hypothetical protein
MLKAIRLIENGVYMRLRIKNPKNGAKANTLSASDQEVVCWTANNQRYRVIANTKKFTATLQSFKDGVGWTNISVGELEIVLPIQL